MSLITGLPGSTITLQLAVDAGADGLTSSAFEKERSSTDGGSTSELSGLTLEQYLFIFFKLLFRTLLLGFGTQLKGFGTFQHAMLGSEPICHAFYLLFGIPTGHGHAQGSTARSDPSGIWPMPAAGRRAAAGCPRFWAHFEISERAKPAVRFQTCAGSPLLLDSLGLAPAGCSNSCKVHRNLQALLCQDKQASSPQSLASSPTKLLQRKQQVQKLVPPA